jgi:hypothetical protein
MSNPTRTYDPNSPLWITPVALAVPPILLGLRALYLNEMPSVLATHPRLPLSGEPGPYSLHVLLGLVLSFVFLLIFGSVYANLVINENKIENHANNYVLIPLFLMIVLFLIVCAYWWVGSDPANLMKLSALSIAVSVTALITSQTQVNTR